MTGTRQIDPTTLCATCPGGTGSSLYHRQRAFTLIELVIALFVLSILTSLAVSSYRNYARRGNIAAAFAELDRYSIRMTKAYQDNGNYGVGNCAATIPAGTAGFDFACVLTQGNQGFTVTATGSGGMAGYAFSSDSEGVHMTLVFPGVAAPVNCWMAQENRCL